MKIWILILVFALTAGTFGDVSASRILDGITAYQNNNYAEAVNIFEPLAKLGDSDAQTWLGIIYLKYDGPNYDIKEARRLFGLAAEQGNARSQGKLGELYTGPFEDKNGFRIESDYQTAALWFQKGADGGDVGSQFHLSGLYQWGLGVQPDRAKAIKYARLAAEQGHSVAYLNLAHLLSNIPEFDNQNASSEDQKEAVYWYEKAARDIAGSSYQTTAMYALAGIYTYGRGVPVDKVKGYMWFLLTAAHDNSKVSLDNSEWSYAQDRDAAGKELTSEERSEAEQMAREWSKK